MIKACQTSRSPSNTRYGSVPTGWDQQNGMVLLVLLVLLARWWTRWFVLLFELRGGEAALR